MDVSTPQAVNPLPAAVIGLAVVIFGIEMLFGLADRGIVGGAAGAGLRATAIRDYGFYGEAWDWMLSEGRFPPELLVRLVSYPLLHVSFTQALFVCVFVLAMGKMVGTAMGNRAVLILFFVPAAVGAVGYGLVLDDPAPLVGGFPGVYGLIGGYTFMLWVSLGVAGSNQLQAFQLIAALMAIQLLFGLLLGASRDWLADLIGFVVGFALSFMLVPGGWARLRDKLRQR